MTELMNVLITRDAMICEDAVAEIAHMRQRIKEGEDIEEMLDELGLEPDYLFDLL